MTVTKREMKAILKRFKSTDVNNILQKAGVKIFKDLRRVSRNMVAMVCSFAVQLISFLAYFRNRSKKMDVIDIEYIGILSRYNNCSSSR